MQELANFRFDRSLSLSFLLSVFLRNFGPGSFRERASLIIAVDAILRIDHMLTERRIFGKEKFRELRTTGEYRASLKLSTIRCTHQTRGNVPANQRDPIFNHPNQQFRIRALLVE